MGGTGHHRDSAVQFAVLNLQLSICNRCYAAVPAAAKRVIFGVRHSGFGIS
jgi:hypothetical protein